MVIDFAVAVEEKSRPMPIKKYYVVSGFNLKELQDQVNVAIDGDNAVPIGGVWSSWHLGWRSQIRTQPPRLWLWRKSVPVLTYRFGFRRMFHQAMIDPGDDMPTMPPLEEA